MSAALSLLGTAAGVLIGALALTMALDVYIRWRKRGTGEDDHTKDNTRDNDM